MVEIRKYMIGEYRSFDISTDEGVFQIWFGGNLDLYFRYEYNGNKLYGPDSKSFYITKENYFLFSLFDELYEDVKNYNIFVPDAYITEAECLENRERFREADLHNPRKLFKDNKVDWHCDDFDYDDGGRFVIEKLDDCYKLTFNKCKNDSFFGVAASYSVRIRNSGSRYGYFNMVFMRLYNKLCEFDYEYDQEFHQIHIEEYMYHKSKVRRKETI